MFRPLAAVATYIASAPSVLACGICTLAIGGGRDWGSLGAKPTLGIIGVGPQGSKHRGRTTGVEAQGSKHEARQGAIQRARDGCKPDAREQAIGAELPVYIYTRPVFTGLSTSNHNGSI